MLGIFLIYWIGKQFYTLAEKHKKGNWLYAILGIGIYYATQFALGIGLAIIWYSTHTEEFDPGMGVSLLGVAAGALACWGMYTFLEYRWSEAAKRSKAESYLQDSDLLDDDLVLAE